MGIWLKVFECTEVGFDWFCIEGKWRYLLWLTNGSCLLLLLDFGLVIFGEARKAGRCGGGVSEK